MGAASKRARKIRHQREFALAKLMSAAASAPKITTGAYSWDLAAIVNARNMQMSGNFQLPARMAESMRTDDALFIAYENRLDALASIAVEMKPAKGARGKSFAEEAEGTYGERGVGLTSDTVRSVQGCLVNHRVAFATNTWVPRDDGSRVDVVVNYWPIEFVRWDAPSRTYKTRVDGGPEETIVHGDGRWIVFHDVEHEPFKSGTLLPAAIVWARHAFAIRDWAKSSVSHAAAKVVGSLPEGMPLEDAEGKPTAEAEALLALLQAVASDDTLAGLLPSGSKADFMANSSTNYQIFTELVSNGERAAARIYLGTDGTLGSNGGAPGVDISALFGVATTKIQGDIRCIQRCLATGSIDIWTAINFGDSSLAPSRTYRLPDPDADAEKASRSQRLDAFNKAIDDAKKNGFVVDQEYVDAIAEMFDLDPPRLPAAPEI